MKAGIARILTVLAALSLAALPAAGKDNLLASPYGPVVVDLLFAFHATEVPCLGPVDISDVCFTANPATAGALADAVVSLGGAVRARPFWLVRAAGDAAPRPESPRHSRTVLAHSRALAYADPASGTGLATPSPISAHGRIM